MVKARLAPWQIGDNPSMNDSLVDVWNQLCDRLREAGQILADPRAPKDSSTQAYGLNYLLNLLNSGIELTVMSVDPDHPEIGRPQDATKKWGLDCPDALYARTTIDGAGSYLLRGSQGTAHYVGIAVSAGSLGTAGVRGLGNLAKPGDLEVATDGSFAVMFSPDRHDGNWIETPPEIVHVNIRQFLYDWENETTSALSIERLDRPTAGMSFTADEMARRVDALGSFMTSSARLWTDFVEGLRERCFNSFAPPNMQSSTYGGTPDNVYGSGYFELAPDEAVIVEFTPPPCHYWNVQIGSYWFESLDFVYRMGSLNGFQARLDGSGNFVGVIAHRDPGIWNWLDTAGNGVTPATYRWQLPRVPRDEVPTPRTRVVPFAALARELPASTPTITPAERTDQLDRRRRGALRRYGR
jgi:hypothetical protein